MRKVITSVLSALLAIVAAELCLHAYFHESEATRNYWGKNAFVADPDRNLLYRHSPNSEAYAAREGTFGPDLIHTNNEGFRDPRDFSENDPVVPRIAVGGASFTFGLGVASNRAIFSAQLEQILKADTRFPHDLDVVNLSQSGYHINQVCRIVELELQKVKPQMVILAVNQYDAFLLPSEELRPDFQNGYRLPPARLFKGGSVDWLRSHSFVMMRCSFSPLLNFQGWYRDQLATKVLGARVGSRSGMRVSPADGAETAGESSIPPSLQRFREILDGRNIDLLCMVIYRPGDTTHALSDRLRKANYNVVDVRSKPNWVLGGDGHWNEFGHHEAATLVAEAIPVDTFSASHPEPVWNPPEGTEQSGAISAHPVSAAQQSQLPGGGER